MSARDREAGFTLLETLAAVAATAAILGAVAAIAGQWMPLWRHGFQALQNADLIGLGLDRVVADVGAAEYARFGGPAAPVFRGEPRGVVFIRRGLGPSAAPGLELVRISEAQSRGGAQATRTRATLSSGAAGEWRDATTLLPASFTLEFAYAGPDRRWLPSWTAQDRLPRAVRLTVLGANGAVVASTAFPLKVTAAAEITTPSLDSDAPPKAP